MVSVRGLRKSFGETEVLKGIDLEVPKGSICVVLGGSGMGKSVLMKHLIGLLQPTKGNVVIDGQDLAELGALNMKLFRRKFGMVFQQAALFDSMTNYENVAFPLREHKNLSSKDLHDKVDGLLTLFSLDPERVGPRFPSEISGGQRKRVGLARAVALEPSLVLYDEPTTGLDPITTDQVDDMILHAKKELGITSIVISHDIASAFKIADQMVFIYEGEIIVRGTRDDMLACEHPFAKKFFATWGQKNL
ncbi:MAG: ATP-binding cassette domain-containing protein [Deltaproteobacteria bacterium]|nr:ATP-binding cassette domain-containing protein [Deltaproteobacteria bacterium]